MRSGRQALMSDKHCEVFAQNTDVLPMHGKTARMLRVLRMASSVSKPCQNEIQCLQLRPNDPYYLATNLKSFGFHEDRLYPLVGRLQF